MDITTCITTIFLLGTISGILAVDTGGETATKIKQTPSSTATTSKATGIDTTLRAPGKFEAQMQMTTIEPFDYDDPTTETFGIESVVAGPLRVWHIAGIIGLSISVVVVVLCCIFDCRIPRSKEEIEKNNEKRRIAFKYAEEMTKIHINDVKIVKKDDTENASNTKKQNKAFTKTTEVNEEQLKKRRKKKRSSSVVYDSDEPLGRHPTDVVKPSKKQALALDVPNEKATARTLKEISEQKKRKTKDPKV